MERPPHVSRSTRERVVRPPRRFADEVCEILGRKPRAPSLRPRESGSIIGHQPRAPSLPPRGGELVLPLGHVPRASKVTPGVERHRSPPCAREPAEEGMHGGTGSSAVQAVRDRALEKRERLLRERASRRQRRWDAEHPDERLRERAPRSMRVRSPEITEDEEREFDSEEWATDPAWSWEKISSELSRKLTSLGRG